MVSSERTADSDVLTWRGQTWTVESEPTAVETDGDSVLLEVWVKRGESIGESE